MKTSAFVLALLFAAPSLSVAHTDFTFNDLQGPVVSAQQPVAVALPAASNPPAVADERAFVLANTSLSAENEPDFDRAIAGNDAGDDERGFGLGVDDDDEPDVLDADGLPIYH